MFHLWLTFFKNFFFLLWLSCCSCIVDYHALLFADFVILVFHAERDITNGGLKQCSGVSSAEVMLVMLLNDRIERKWPHSGYRHGVGNEKVPSSSAGSQLLTATPRGCCGDWQITGVRLNSPFMEHLDTVLSITYATKSCRVHQVENENKICIFIRTICSTSTDA